MISMTGGIQMVEPFKLADESYYLIENWQKSHSGIIAGFTTKSGGFSEGPYKTNNMGFHVFDNHEAVVKNRERLAKQISFSLPLDFM